MVGWNLKSGLITNLTVTEEQYWELFNFVFSDSCMKRNTYKFGLIKAILDNLLNVSINTDYFLSYHDIFEKFTESYWNLVLKYDLRQMRKDGKSERSLIEVLLNNEVALNSVIRNIEFDSLCEIQKNRIVSSVANVCKRYVLGALYKDFEGTLYAFDLSDSGIIINKTAYEFMLKYKSELEKLNYYAWAKFLEKINSDDVLTRVIEKLELSVHQRNDLSVYRMLLKEEFEENTCFYCGRKLTSNNHVDHFIPWSFTKEDKLWNFVLACPSCNIKKSNRIASSFYLEKLVKRNSFFMNNQNHQVKADFYLYNDNLIVALWKYAKQSGYKEIDL